MKLSRIFYFTASLLMLLIIEVQILFGLLYSVSFGFFGMEYILQATPFFIVALAFFSGGFLLYKLPMKYYFLTLIIPTISLIYGIIRTISSIKNINSLIDYYGSYSSWFQQFNNDAFFTTLGVLAWIIYMLFFVVFICSILYEMKKNKK